MGKRIFKTVLMFCIAVGFSVVLYFLCRPFISIWYEDYVGVYGAFTWTRLKEVGFDTILKTDYAKYVYLTLCCWLIAIATIITSVIRLIRRMWCITQRDCLACQNYLTCRDKLIRQKRNY